MKCKDIQRRLSAFMDGELSNKDKTQIASHIQACPDCARVLDRLTHTWEILDCLPEAELTPHFYLRLKSRMTSGKEDRSESRIQRVLMPASAVAVLAMGILIGNLVGKNGDVINGHLGVEEEMASALHLDSFDDFPNTSVGEAYLDLAYTE